MGASPDTPRAVLLGAGLGLGLAGLEVVSAGGWWGGLGSIAAIAQCSADEPDDVATQCGRPSHAAKRFSSSGTILPY